ncbi:MAG: hypothetical protein KGZ58_13730, partial [Ignavibacteriales bacterium]|nr:hypothetical protein [Ignavibacteriales bacterium]
PWFYYEWWAENFAITDREEALQYYTQFNNLTASNSVPTIEFDFIFNIGKLKFGVFDNIIMGDYTFQAKGQYSYGIGRSFV